MISGTISAHDYLLAHRLHRMTAHAWALAVGGAILFIGVALLVYGQQNVGLVAVFTGGGALVGELFVAYVVLPRKVKKLHGQQKSLSESITYSWNQRHIEAKSSSGSSRRVWGDYCKIKESEYIFLLYHADNLFEMVPKAWFKSESMVAEFRKIANAAAGSGAA